MLRKSLAIATLSGLALMSVAPAAFADSTDEQKEKVNEPPTRVIFAPKGVTIEEKMRLRGIKGKPTKALIKRAGTRLRQTGD